MWVRPLGWEYTLEEGMASPLVFLPRESHGQKSLTGNSPQGRKESDMTEATQQAMKLKDAYSLEEKL